MVLEGGKSVDLAIFLSTHSEFVIRFCHCHTTESLGVFFHHLQGQVLLLFF